MCQLIIARGKLASALRAGLDKRARLVGYLLLFLLLLGHEEFDLRLFVAFLRLGCLRPDGLGLLDRRYQFLLVVHAVLRVVLVRHAVDEAVLLDVAGFAILGVPAAGNQLRLLLFQIYAVVVTLLDCGRV